MNNGELRVAIVGYGLSGSVFHAPLIAATPGMRVTTVVTANPDRRRRALEEIPEVTVVQRLDELWDRATDHHLVVVVTPTGTHLSVGLAAVEAGLPLVVDKPLAPSAAAARQLVAAAEGRDLMLSVFHNRRWDGDTRTVRRLVAEDALGSVARFESRFERYRPAVREDAWRERTPAEEGGGILLDLGSHVIDQALHLFGPAVRVYGEVRVLREGAVADDDAFVAVEHAGGVRSHLWASAIAAIPGPRVRVLGVGGAYEKFGLDIQEDELRAGKRADAPDWGVEPPERWGKLVTPAGERAIATERGAWTAYYAGIREALITGAPPPVDGPSAVAVVDVIDAARTSTASRSVVDVGEGQA